ncbi:MAG: FtsW/RodA/SpoVE family cell cycle protein [Rectinemataceae bacterium]|nr:FtsW/RodA/SpoVE family cell cycle protein [Spirochaetaceae bacterium]
MRSSGGEYDKQLIAAMAVLALLGLISLWSGSIGFALRNGGPLAVIGKQAIVTLLSLVVFGVAALLPLSMLRTLIPAMCLGSLALLVLPLLPGIGGTINNAKRWIRIGGFTLQPSEFWKPVMVLYMAHFLDRHREQIKGSSYAAMPALGFVICAIFIITLQSDFSTAALVAAIALAVLWFAGMKILFIVNIGGLAALYAVIVVLLSQYRLQRILGYLNPEEHAQGASYQMIKSLRAIRAGGLLGTGIGLGTNKLASIPEIQSDFIFAAYAEETGFLGVVLFFALWAFIAWRVVKRLKDAHDFPRVAGLGILSALLLQVLVNLAVVSGLIPTTGMALPFFSAGGTSVLATSFCFGLLVNFTAATHIAPSFEPIYIHPVGRGATHV